MANLSPQEMEAWLLGLKSLLSGEVVRELASEVRRQQMDGAAFSALVASRTTPPSLREVIRPSHMATLRRCWNSERPKSKSGGVERRDENRSTNARPDPEVRTATPSATPIATPVAESSQPFQAGRQRPDFGPPVRGRRDQASVAFSSPAIIENESAGACALEDDDPSPPPAQEVPAGEDVRDGSLMPRRDMFRDRKEDGDCYDKAVRPPQVPRLDLSTLHAKEGESGRADKLGTQQWNKPGKHPWTETGPQYPAPKTNNFMEERPGPAIEGFACATVEDQQRIAEFYGYRDEGFVATMHGLKTDCIRPRLYLGTMADAAYWPLLQSLCITHILNVAIEAQRAQPPYDAQGIQYMLLQWQDSAEQAHSLHRQRFRQLREATRFIDRSLNTTFDVKGKARKASVLVHCVQGLNRSAAIACAYLMEYEGVSLDRAMAEVRDKHRGCLSSRHWQDLLHKFDAELLRGI